MDIRRRNLQASLIAAIAFSAFSATDVIVKFLSVRQGVLQTTFMVSIMALLIIVSRIKITNQTVRLWPRYPRLAFIRATLISINTLLIYYAFAHLPLAEAYVLAFLTPVLVAVIAFVWLRERLSLRGWIGVVLGFAGVIWVLRPGVAPVEAGHLAALGAALLFSIALILLRRAKADESDTALVIALLLVQSTLSGALMLYAGPSAIVWLDLGLAFMAGVFVSFAQIMLVKAFRLGTASVVAPVQYTQLIWGFLYGALFFGAPVEAHMLIGAVIILISGWLVLK